MSTDERMNAVLRAWREGVRGKERRVFRLEERIELRMDAIEKRMRRIRVPLDDWEIRQFRCRDRSDQTLRSGHPAHRHGGDARRWPELPAPEQGWMT